MSANYGTTTVNTATTVLTLTTRRRRNKRTSETEVEVPKKLLPQDTPRKSPLPSVSFADGTEIWDLMCKMDVKYTRSPDLLKYHPEIRPQMRAVTIDWMMDVCEYFRFHRETLYLAIDYLDRYIAAERNIKKQHLQLIGISCLFVASKIEEFYSLPKVSLLADIAAGTCTTEEILDMEVTIMKKLTWKLTPITPCNWLNIYLQVLGANESLSANAAPNPSLRTSSRRNKMFHRDQNNRDYLLTRPMYSGIDFVKAIRILDLCSLDMGSIDFTYSTLAAAAIYNTKGKKAALEASGFSWEALRRCAHWMSPFARVVNKDNPLDVLPSIQEDAEEPQHLIQSQCVSLAMLVLVETLLFETATKPGWTKNIPVRRN